MELYNFRATCTNVVDGDTADLVIDVGFHLTTKQRVRFLGINTPERNQAGYQEAKDFVIESILGKDIIVQTYKTDAFGRYLATLYVDNVNLNVELLEKGLAKEYIR